MRCDVKGVLDHQIKNLVGKRVGVSWANPAARWTLVELVDTTYSTQAKLVTKSGRELWVNARDLLA